MDSATASGTSRMTHPGVVRVYLQSLNRDIRFFLKLLMSSVLWYSGGIWLHRTIRRMLGRPGRIIILAYHSVNDQENYLDLIVPVKLFEKHVAFLKKHYEILSLMEAVELLKRGSPLAKDYAVITFDDGYLDNFTNVFPIARKHQVPFTIFFAVQPIETGKPLTVDLLISLMRHRRSKHLNLSRLQLPEYPLFSKVLAEFAIKQINNFAKQLDDQQKEELLDLVSESCGVDRSQVGDGWITWDQVRELAANGVELGAHTVTHPRLSMISGSRAQSEIAESKRIIEERTGKAVKFFAYPYGGHSDFGRDHEAMVGTCGFEAACSLINGDNLPGSNLFRLQRINANWTFWKQLPLWSLPLFAAELAGIFQRLWRGR